MTGLSDELAKLNTQGWSTRDIERTAERHGHKLHHSTVSLYLSGKHPEKTSPRVLEAFAAVFGVNVNRLRTAAGLPGLAEPFELEADAARLTAPQRDAVRRVVRQFIEANDAASAGHAEGVPGDAVSDVATTQMSDRGLRLVSDDVDPAILEMPYAADEEKPGDDPGEDHH